MATLISYLEPVFLVLLAGFSLSVLIIPNPSLSALFLSIQTGIIAVYLSLISSADFTSISAIYILFAFSLITVVINSYIEKSTQFLQLRSPKISAFLGGGLLAIFFTYLTKIKANDIVDFKNTHSLFSESPDALLFAFFIIISILISAMSIIQLKGND